MSSSGKVLQSLGGNSLRNFPAFMFLIFPGSLSRRGMHGSQVQPHGAPVSRPGCLTPTVPPDDCFRANSWSVFHHGMLLLHFGKFPRFLVKAIHNRRKLSSAAGTVLPRALTARPSKPPPPSTTRNASQRPSPFVNPSTAFSCGCGSRWCRKLP